MAVKKKKKLLWVVIPVSTIAIIALTVVGTRLIFWQSRIVKDLEWLGSSLKNVNIVDQKVCWNNIYVKTELQSEEYERLKQSFVRKGGTSSNKDFTDLLDGDSGYHYEGFEISIIENIKNMYGYESMNLDDYDEMLITKFLYGKAVGFLEYSTGVKHYVLVKENSGNCYLYICA